MAVDFSTPSKIDGMEVYSEATVKSVAKQAARYGEQIRQLENVGLIDDRTRIRQAWRSFLDQLDQECSELWWLARTSYYDAHERKYQPI